jgi:hypothetical protein
MTASEYLPVSKSNVPFWDSMLVGAETGTNRYPFNFDCTSKLFHTEELNQQTLEADS